MSYPALVVFCKRPDLGQGKQRLAAEIGSASALVVARALLNCSLSDAIDWPGQLVISPSSAEDMSWAEKLTDNSLVYPQPAGNLGERLNHVDKRLRKAGHDQILFIGTDAPLLDRQTMMNAAAALQTNDTVLQPAADGGVTLMASKCQWPDLKHLPWSENTLCDTLTALCLLNKQSVSYLEPGYDIDTFGDLKYVLSDLHNDDRPSRQSLVAAIKTINVTAMN